MNEWTNEWLNKLLNKWMNEWMNGWINEWINEWLNEWMNEWVNSWGFMPLLCTCRLNQDNILRFVICITWHCPNLDRVWSIWSRARYLLVTDNFHNTESVPPVLEIATLHVPVTTGVPADTRRIGLMLCQLRSRWTNNEPTLAGRTLSSSRVCPWRGRGPWGSG